MNARLRQWQRLIAEARSEPKLLQDLMVEVSQALCADSCSLFMVHHASDKFVLMASNRLAPEAIGALRVPRDKGLIGEIGQRQEQLRLKDAKSHPAFLEVPGIGEEGCRAYLGVPVLHQGRVVGVLVAQQFGRRTFRSADEALMLTLSAQLAESLSTLAMDRLLEEHAAASRQRFAGQTVSPGVALGRAVFWTPDVSLSSVPDRVVDDPDAELAKLRDAAQSLKEELETAADQLQSSLPETELLLFTAFSQILSDTKLWQEMTAHLQKGLWAPSAVRKAFTKYATRLADAEPGYLAERSDDLLDLGQRLVRKLLVKKTKEQRWPSATVLVAERISAALLASLPQERLVGLVSFKGSPSSHAGILARALGVPAVFGVEGLELESLDNQEMVVDGYRGEVLLNPAAAVRSYYQRRLLEEEEREQRWRVMSKRPAATRDGHRMPLMVNVGSSLDPMNELNSYADGVGLFRTEVPFMLSDRFLSEEQQIALYRKVLKAMKGRPVMIRTLDIGGDKQLPYFSIDDPNPFLGWRGIRVSLDHPELFLSQVRAMMKANRSLGNLHIVLPMVSEVQEFLECRDLMLQAHQELLKEDNKIGAFPPIGLVVEVPSSIFQIRSLARHADFVSVGTNDLTQYLLAVDRGNERVAGRFDALHPAVLCAIREVVRGAHREKTPVHVCGELAGDVMGAALLLGLGVDGLSMSRPGLGRVREMLSAITLSQAQAWARQACAFESGEEVRLKMAQEFGKYRLGHLLSGVEAMHGTAR